MCISLSIQTDGTVLLYICFFVGVEASVLCCLVFRAGYGFLNVFGHELLYILL